MHENSAGISSFPALATQTSKRALSALNVASAVFSVGSVSAATAVRPQKGRSAGGCHYVLGVNQYLSAVSAPAGFPCSAGRWESNAYAHSAGMASISS